MHSRFPTQICTFNLSTVRQQFRCIGAIQSEEINCDIQPQKALKFATSRFRFSGDCLEKCKYVVNFNLSSKIEVARIS